MKSIHARWTLQNLNSPIPVEKLIVLPEAPKLSERINTYFQRTDPIRATLISGLTLSIIAIIALPCLARCCCPRVFRLCEPITRLRNWYSHRKAERALAKKASRVIRIKAIESVEKNLETSAPTLIQLQERINLLTGILLNYPTRELINPNKIFIFNVNPPNENITKRKYSTIFILK